MPFVDPRHIPSTGNPAIDAHHHRIARMVNDLWEVWKADRPKDAVDTRLLALLGEVRDHFVAEEFITRGAGFGDWQGHEPHHNLLRRKMRDIMGHVADTETRSNGMIEAFHFFEELIFDHEFYADQTFWEFFRARPPSPADPLITWTSDYHLGHAEMDRDHEELVGLLNEVRRVMEAPDWHHQTTNRLEALRSSTESHFEREETLMRKIDHPDLRGHSAAHRMLVKDIDEALGHCRNGRQEDLRDFVVNGLRYWFLDHVTNWDARLQE